MKKQIIGFLLGVLVAGFFTIGMILVLGLIEKILS